MAAAAAAPRLAAFVRGTPAYAAAVFFDSAPRGRCAEAAALAAAVRQAGGRAYERRACTATSRTSRYAGAGRGERAGQVQRGGA